MATGLAIVAIVAIVAVNILKPRVAAERLASAEVLVVGDPARMTVRITPTARWSPALELIEPVGTYNQARLGIGRLDDQSIVAYSVPTDRRGVVQIGPLTAVRRDVLGLAQYRRELAEAVEIAVAPRAIPIEMPSIGRGTARPPPRHPGSPARCRRLPRAAQLHRRRRHPHDPLEGLGAGRRVQGQAVRAEGPHEVCRRARLRGTRRPRSVRGRHHRGRQRARQCRPGRTHHPFRVRRRRSTSAVHRRRSMHSTTSPESNP